MFFETREYLGQRRGNAIAVEENLQRYAGNIQTSIDGIGSAGKYSIVIFTVSMPHLNAMGTDYDEKDEPISRFEDWDDRIMTYQRAPLEHFEMQDEISLANARYRFRQDTQATGLDNQPADVPNNGLWGITGNFDKYIQEKREYSVKPGLWEQKPLYFSIRVNHTTNTPFMLIPARM